MTQAQLSAADIVALVSFILLDIRDLVMMKIKWACAEVLWVVSHSFGHKQDLNLSLLT